MSESSLLDSLCASRNPSEIMVLPWSMTIVDCYFLATALASCCEGHEVWRLDNYENELVSSHLQFPGVYDIYGIDRDGGDIDQALVVSGREEFCFWDQDERFVAIAGSRLFLDIACPYPEEIARQRFIETSWNLNGMSDDELATFYDRLKRL
ncbi:hypothetical protein P6166_12700 [Stenotrophomonas sp. HITSZ_GD]|uniref:hypothetical protein n=1 Tax=Stenotrophomonas sp. HITSZ_GD TaxID=3037248 RepID=UPI00240E3D69|nr:hypothetical protein [Stenotrophomonas sp. HITSZ_GD]MDG2526214.1 hypothetical protein [Stenotrophomonas sp. HITSZ_GD]